MKFKKVIYWIGIYTVCTTVDGYLDEVMTGLGRRLHRWAVKEPDAKTKEHRSIDMKTGKAGKPINRIGF